MQDFLTSLSDFYFYQNKELKLDFLTTYHSNFFMIHFVVSPCAGSPEGNSVFADY